MFTSRELRRVTAAEFARLVQLLDTEQAEYETFLEEEAARFGNDSSADVSLDPVAYLCPDGSYLVEEAPHTGEDWAGDSPVSCWDRVPGQSVQALPLDVVRSNPSVLTDDDVTGLWLLSARRAQWHTIGDVLPSAKR